MASKTRRCEAIVLGRTKLGEQDLILTLLSREGEQVRAVAKGARKPGGRLAARSELFCEDQLLLAKGRGELETVSEATTTEAHGLLRGDPDRVSAACAVAEVARLTCFQDMADGFLFPLLSRALAACEEAADQTLLDLVVAAYVFKVLAHEGWRPELDSCVYCGDKAISRFSVAAGGMLCESCAKDVEGAEPLSASEVEWLRALLGLTFDQLLMAELDVRLSTLLLTMAHRWAATHLDARLRAMEFLLGA